MNGNLLLAVMRYKIMWRECGPVQRSLRFASTTALGLLLYLTIILRAHSPYMSAARSSVAYYSLVIIVFCDFVFVPVARFHCKAMRLYRRLWSLAAHMEATDHHVGGARASSSSWPAGSLPESLAYFRHTRWLLTKELSHPEQLANQWATRSLGMPITFPNLVSLHYWFSIIVISVYFEVRPVRDLFGDRLDDPLGLKVYS